MLNGDVEPESADGVLTILRESGFASEDVTLWRATSIQPLAMHHRAKARREDVAVWAEIASRAMSHSRLAGTYLLYMVTAGIVAGIGVAISVTTIPAAAYVGADLGLAGAQGGLDALIVLVTNVVLIQSACVVTLWIQRRLAARRATT